MKAMLIVGVRPQFIKAFSYRVPSNKRVSSARPHPHCDSKDVVENADDKQSPR